MKPFFQWYFLLVALYLSSCLLILICLSPPPPSLPTLWSPPFPDRSSAAVVVSVRERLRLYTRKKVCVYTGLTRSALLSQLCRPLTDSPGPARLILTRPAGLVSLVSSVVSRTGMWQEGTPYMWNLPSLSLPPSTPVVEAGGGRYIRWPRRTFGWPYLATTQVVVAPVTANPAP